ncbi:MAG: hypothetical protein KAU50_07190 [Candidatus Marinimicrobia bacterium]|nr:hypothetical protein [Candidatus Neomarinimicrobiota bacterium]
MTLSPFEVGKEFGREIRLDTKQGNRIQNFQRMEANPAQMRAWTKFIQDQCNRAELRSSTSVYNCVGMVLSSRRTWIDIDIVGWILNQDSYILLSGVAEARPGDLVVYKDTHSKEYAHIGMFLGERLLLEGSNQTEMWVISQFGNFGEWIHPIDHVLPTWKGGIEIWTDRK